MGTASRLAQFGYILSKLLHRWQGETLERKPKIEGEMKDDKI